MINTPIKFAFVIVASVILHIACKKNEPNAQPADCGAVSTTIQTDIEAYSKAAIKYQSAQTAENCNAVKASLTTVINKVKDCPDYASIKGQYETVLKGYNCTSVAN